MAKIIYREHHWTPSVISSLYVDEIDHEGIVFIVNDIEDVYRGIKKKNGSNNSNHI